MLRAGFHCTTRWDGCNHCVNRNHRVNLGRWAELRPQLSMAAMVSLDTGSITPRSQMIARISRAGVTSKAGL